MNQKRQRKSSKGWVSYEGDILLDEAWPIAWYPDTSEGKMEQY